MGRETRLDTRSQVRAHWSKCIFLQTKPFAQHFILRQVPVCTSWPLLTPCVSNCCLLLSTPCSSRSSLLCPIQPGPSSVFYFAEIHPDGGWELRLQEGETRRSDEMDSLSFGAGSHRLLNRHLLAVLFFPPNNRKIVGSSGVKSRSSFYLSPPPLLIPQYICFFFGRGRIVLGDHHVVGSSNLDRNPSQVTEYVTGGGGVDGGCRSAGESLSDRQI